MAAHQPIVLPDPQPIVLPVQETEIWPILQR